MIANQFHFKSNYASQVDFLAPKDLTPNYAKYTEAHRFLRTFSIENLLQDGKIDNFYQPTKLFLRMKYIYDSIVK